MRKKRYENMEFVHNLLRKGPVDARCFCRRNKIDILYVVRRLIVHGVEIRRIEYSIGKGHTRNEHQRFDIYYLLGQESQVYAMIKGLGWEKLPDHVLMELKAKGQ